MQPLLPVQLKFFLTSLGILPMKRPLAQRFLGWVVLLLSLLFSLMTLSKAQVQASTDRPQPYAEGTVIVSGPVQIVQPSGNLSKQVRETCQAKPLPGLHNLALQEWMPLTIGASPTERAIGIYTITGEVTTKVVIEWMNKHCQKQRVLAEPNYALFLGKANWGAADGPFAMWWRNNQEPSAFTQQWALESINILNDQHQRQPVATGTGIRVGIFDTAPVGITPVVFPLQVHGGYLVNSTGVLDPYYSSDPLHFPCDPANPTANPRSGTNYAPAREHGMAVASLAHLVAPDSMIDLYHVINDCGFTFLDRLMPALHDFISDVNATGQPAIINLSLGSSILPTATLPYGVAGQSVTLEELLNTARQSGIVTVAAAGNDSGKPAKNAAVPGVPTSPPNIEPMNWPAAYAQVIGVAATTSDGGRACFSNRGDLAAPGGQGGLGYEITGQPYDCSPRQPQAGTTTERNALVALSSSGQLLDVTGTSFAAPLVAATIALLWEEQALPVDATTPDRLAALLHCNLVAPFDPDLGAGRLRWQRAVPAPNGLCAPMAESFPDLVQAKGRTDVAKMQRRLLYLPLVIQ